MNEKILAEIIFGSQDNYVYCLDGEISGDPPGKQTKTGPRTGAPGTVYTYDFSAIDPNGKDVSYYIYWGDGITSYWTPYHTSGETYSENHVFHSMGTFKINAKARIYQSHVYHDGRLDCL